MASIRLLSRSRRAIRGASAILLSIAFSTAASSCGTGGGAAGASLRLEFAYGDDEYADWPNVYAAWIEGEGGFYQNILVCEKLITDMAPPSTVLTNTAIPHWSTVVYGESDPDEVEAVTAATVARQDFSISATLKAGCPRRFTVYFETDQSFDGNAWFSDQPALIYAAEVDLDASSGATLPFELIGWVPNEATGLGSFTMGSIQSELRYITNAKDGSDFGAANPDESATRAVGSLSVTVTEIVPVTSPGTPSGGPDAPPDGTTGATS